ncbi:MAG: hypothetical protein ACOZNI_22480 [Myxococcota bacterium]
MRATFVFSFTLATVAACAARTPGAQPHEMGSAAHEEESRREERAAASHEEQYEPGATTTRVECGTAGFGRQVCWTSVVNPTEAHLREAERHRRAAADHRAASTALQSAEASACVGIADDDRDISPFEHTEDAAAVAPLYADRPGAQTGQELEGAVVTLRDVPGLTGDWLQRIVDCHLARNVSLGHVVPEMPDCPLVPVGARATVASVPEGFRVEIRSEDDAAAADILARARRLVEPRAAR